MSFEKFLQFNRQWLLVICIGVIDSACTNDFEPFQTRKTALANGNPKVRVLNLHANKTVSVKIGGRIFADNIEKNKLTAFIEIDAPLLGDSVMEVFDQDGKSLNRQKVAIAFGSNYTFTVIPKYDRVRTTFQMENTESGPKRWLYHPADTAVIVVPIVTSALPPLPDRFAFRHAALAIDQASGQGISSYPLNWFNARYPASSGRDGREFTLPLNYFSPVGYNKNAPPEWQMSPYYILKYGENTVIETQGVNNVGDNDKPLMSGAAQYHQSKGYDFLIGHSYTIITSGTHGVLNDVVTPSDNDSPIALEPIAYEMFILDDNDGVEQTLQPLQQFQGLEASGPQLDLQHLSPSNNGNIISMTIDNAQVSLFADLRDLYTTGARAASFLPYTISSNYQTLGWYTEYGTDQIGVKTVGVTPLASTSPILASSQPIELKLATRYSTYYYEDGAGKGKLMTVGNAAEHIEGVMRVRLIHLSPDAGEISIIASSTNEVLVPTLRFEERSPYVEVPHEDAIIKIVMVSSGEEIATIDLSTYQDVSLSLSGYASPDSESPVFPENRLRIKGVYVIYPPTPVLNGDPYGLPYLRAADFF